MRVLFVLLALGMMAGPVAADDRRTLPPAAVKVADALIAAADAEDVPAFLALFAERASGHGRSWADEEIRSAKSITHAFGLRRGNWIMSQRGDAVIVYRDDPSGRELTVFELAEADGAWAVRDVYFTSGATPAPAAPEVTSGLDDRHIVGGLLGAEGSRSAPPPSTTLRRATRLPKVKIGAVTAKGGLDKAIVLRYLRRQLARITYCYEKTLVEPRPPRGTMKITFAVEADGSVAAAKAAGVRADVAECVQGVVAATMFPKPSTGTVDVRVPIQFR